MTCAFRFFEEAVMAWLKDRMRKATREKYNEGRPFVLDGGRWHSLQLER